MRVWWCQKPRKELVPVIVITEIIQQPNRDAREILHHTCHSTHRTVAGGAGRVQRLSRGVLGVAVVCGYRSYGKASQGEARHWAWGGHNVIGSNRRVAREGGLRRTPEFITRKVPGKVRNSGTPYTNRFAKTRSLGRFSASPPAPSILSRSEPPLIAARPSSGDVQH